LHWFLVLAVTDEAEPRLGSFVVSHTAPGIRIEPVWNTTGMRATASHDVIFDDVPVPLGHVLDLAPARLGRRFDSQQFAWFMTLIGAVYHGIARAARDDVVAFANTFTPGALTAPIASLPLIQDQLGEIEVLLEPAIGYWHRSRGTPMPGAIPVRRRRKFAMWSSRTPSASSISRCGSPAMPAYPAATR
jgi:alkylation response protein AidB-like acyl-CoA dehydrogenase